MRKRSTMALALPFFAQADDADASRTNVVQFLHLRSVDVPCGNRRTFSVEVYGSA